MIRRLFLESPLFPTKNMDIKKLMVIKTSATTTLRTLKKLVAWGVKSLNIKPSRGKTQFFWGNKEKNTRNSKVRSID